MKIKADFITNSSTSSYVLFGIELEHDINSLPDKFLENFFNTQSAYYKPEQLQDDDYRYEIINESVHSISGGLEGYTPYDWGVIWIGMGPDKIGGDETLNQFKQRIVDELTKLGFDVEFKDIKYIEEAFQDG